MVSSIKLVCYLLLQSDAGRFFSVSACATPPGTSRRRTLYHVLSCIFHRTFRSKKCVFFRYSARFRLRGLEVDLDAAGLGRRGIGLGSRPRGLALVRGPWPARRARSRNIRVSFTGTPSRSAEHSRQRQTPLFAQINLKKKGFSRSNTCPLSKNDLPYV